MVNFFFIFIYLFIYLFIFKSHNGGEIFVLFGIKELMVEESFCLVWYKRVIVVDECLVLFDIKEL